MCAQNKRRLRNLMEVWRDIRSFDNAVVTASSKLVWKHVCAAFVLPQVEPSSAQQHRQLTFGGSAFVGVAAYEYLPRKRKHVRMVDADTGSAVWYVGRLAWRCKDKLGGAVKWYEVDPRDPTLYHEVVSSAEEKRDDDNDGGAEEDESEGRFAWSDHAKTPLFPLRGVKFVEGTTSICIGMPIHRRAAQFVAASAPAPLLPTHMHDQSRFVPSTIEEEEENSKCLAAVGDFVGSGVAAGVSAGACGAGLNYDVFGKHTCPFKADVNAAIQLVVRATFADPGATTAVVLDTRFLETTRAVGAHVTWAPNIDIEEARAMQAAASEYRVLPTKRAAWAAKFPSEPVPRVHVVPVTLGDFFVRYMAGAASFTKDVYSYPALDVVCADYTSTWPKFAAADMAYLATTPGLLASPAVVTVTSCLRGDKDLPFHKKVFKRGVSPRKKYRRLQEQVSVTTSASALVVRDTAKDLSPAAATIVQRMCSVFEAAHWIVNVQCVMQYNRGTMVFVAVTVCRADEV
jgi:hypothetical protein